MHQTHQLHNWTKLIPHPVEPRSMLYRRTVSQIFGGKTIRDHINGLTTKAYWEKRRDLTEGVWNKIDWELIERAMQEVPLHQQHWVSKYVSGHFATGKNMHKWKFRRVTQCPRFPKPVEDKWHILECPNPSAHKLWDKSLKQLEDWLKLEGTDISI